MSGGVALGMFEGSTYEAGEVHLNPGDALLMYSDGLTEAESPDGAAVRRGRPRADAGALCGRLPEVRRGRARDARSSTPSSGTAGISASPDDLTVLVLSRLA